MGPSFISSRILFFLSILLLSSHFSFSKVSFIAADDTIKPLPRIDKHFLVVVHIALDKEDQPNIMQADISSALSGINTMFAPIGASFSVCEFRTIPNFTYDTLSEKYYDELLVKYNAPHRINIYYVSAFPDKSACGFATLKGISFTSKPFIVMLKGSCNNSGTLAHEMGHYFGLPHTFEGSGSELADGSNCMTEGDRICDTPADPYIDGAPMEEYVNANCLFINQRKDANGDYYDPDVSNIMSYYPCKCGNFTNEQYITMTKYYLSNPLVW